MNNRHALPTPRGAVSASLFRRLATGRGTLAHPIGDVCADDDTQLALHCIYELSYRGLSGVDASMETDAAVLDLRRDLERRMEQELRSRVGVVDQDASELLAEIAAEDSGPSLSKRFESEGTLEQMQEFAIHRSAYQLKEADPHSLAIPRLAGRAKSALITIQFDEYGNGVPGEAHSELFAETMIGLDLDPTYGAYIDRLPGVTLATGNLIGLLGSTRRLLPALLGHLALFEMCSVGPMARYARTLERLNVPAAGRRFYDVHVVADAVHEVIALNDLVGGFLDEVPRSERAGASSEIGFGALALCAVEGDFSSHLTASFDAGASSLLPETSCRLAAVA